MTSKLLGQAIGLSGTTGNSTNITISSNGTVQLAANGGTDIFIAANDNIGFGNTTPVDKLSIQGSLYTSSNTVTLGTAAYIVANGNIGIGNTAPAQKLVVTGTANVSGNVVFGGDATVTGNVTVSSNNLSVGGQVVAPSYGMKNRLINGVFEIWQRGTTVTLVTNGSQHRADRWGGIYFQNARHQRVAVSSAPTGLYARYACRASSSTTAEVAGGTRITCDQVIENINCFDLVGQTVTLSFWVKFSAATISSSTATAYGDFTGGFMFSSSTADAASWSTAYGSNVLTTITNGSLPTTWTKYTVTGTVPAGTTNIAVRFTFSGLGSTAVADTAYYDVTQVQLEQGPVATPYEFRQYGTELLLCQRYYQNSSATNNLTAFTINGGDNLGTAHPTGVLRFGYKFPVVMRGTPIVAIYDAVGASNKVSYYTTTWLNGGSISVGPTATATGFYLGHNIASSNESQFQYNAIAEI